VLGSNTTDEAPLHVVLD